MEEVHAPILNYWPTSPYNIGEQNSDPLYYSPMNMSESNVSEMYSIISFNETRIGDYEVDYVDNWGNPRRLKRRREMMENFLKKD